MPKLPAPLRKKLIALVLAGAGTFTIATHYTGYWEGKENSTYIDPTGTPTICYGHTGPDVKPGMTLTDEECLELLEKDMKWAFAAIDRRVQVPLTRGQTVALASWIFWAGETNFRNSTLLRLINAGQIPAEWLADCLVPPAPEPFTFGASVTYNLQLLAVIKNCNVDKASIRRLEARRQHEFTDMAGTPAVPAGKTK